ncbi:MAG: ksha1, partial [Myxococcaceae bacterium]|nr:ksha1 [Myxococcaceae bacterium]
MPMRKLRLVSNDLYDETYPASWYAVAPSRRVPRGGLAAIDAFGERLVVWRDEDGAAHVQQRFCPHMGASLACGSVEGKRVVCPFHRWEFDADGSCARVPYLHETKIPKRARLETSQRFHNHPLLILENGCDAQHFKTVHKIDFEHYEVKNTVCDPHR